MTPLAERLTQGLLAGSVAGLTSAAALALAGRNAGCGAYAPINAPANWLFGAAALRARAPSLRYTGTGYLIHHGSALLWGTVYAQWLQARTTPRSWGRRLGIGAATAALACFVDYRVAPARLRPGFERHLSREALFGVYAALALGFAVSGSLAHAAGSPQA